MSKVLITGNFNIVHPGHIRLFRFAKEIGDELVVGIQSDKLAAGGVLLPEDLRLEGVEVVSYVNKAIIFDDIQLLIEVEKPDYIVKGKEFEGADNIEKLYLDKLGGQLIFCSGESNFSGVEMLSDEINFPRKPNLLRPKEFIVRHNINIQNLIRHVKDFSGLNVLVIGDLIVDEYISCNPLGMSQEDPTIVVTPISSSKYVGGAGIVAAHAAGMGAKVHFFSVVGNDDSAKYAKEKLKDYGVRAYLVPDNTRPTTLKQRYRSKQQTLLRVSHLRQVPIAKSIQINFLNSLKNIIQDIDLVVFSDFNYGCLPQDLVNEITELAIQNNVMIIADSQSSSQIGDVSRFKNVKLLTPTEREARISTKNYADGLVELAKHLILESFAENVFLKMSSDGVLVLSKLDEPSPEWHTDRIPALNLSPKDTAGAGDSMLICSGLALAAGANIWEAGLLGSLAAGIQIGRVGNTPITSDELIKELE